MTAPDLDALIERINALADCSYWANAGWDIPGDATQVIGRLAVQAAAALVQLRDSEALARGKIAEQMIEIARLTKLETECWSNPEAWMKWCDVRVLECAERAEAEVARLKDALRQANGVRDVFASAVVAQAMQDIDPAKVKPCDCVRPEIHGHQLLCKHGKAR